MLDTAYRLGRLREALLSSSQADLNDWEIVALDDAIKALEERGKQVADLRGQGQRAARMLAAPTIRKNRKLCHYWEGYKRASAHALQIVK